MNQSTAPETDSASPDVDASAAAPDGGTVVLGKRKNLLWLWVGGGLALVILIAILAVYFGGSLGAQVAQNNGKDRVVRFGAKGDAPVIGRWAANDGDSNSIAPGDRVGVRRGSKFYLDVNGNGVWNGAPADTVFDFGAVGDVALSGDWDGNGKNEIGVHRGNQFYLDYNGNGVWDVETETSDQRKTWDRLCTFGAVNDKPIVGDWSDQGHDQIGVQRGDQFFLDFNGNCTWDDGNSPGYYKGGGDKQCTFGAVGDVAIVRGAIGGPDIIGVQRGSQFFLDGNGNCTWDGVSGNGYTNGIDTLYNFGAVGDVPIMGDWNNDGSDEIGVKRGATFYLDVSGDGTWNP